MIAKKITGAQHPLVKHFFRLRSSKPYRTECQTVLLSGEKLIAEISQNIPLKRLLLPLGREWAGVEAEEVLFLAPELFKKVTGLESPELIAAEVAMPKPRSLSGCDFVLALDRVNDPGNLGTLLRTALALGWEGVYLIEGSVDLFNDKALRAAKGATFHLPYQIGTQDAFLSWVAKTGVTPYAADLEGVKPSSLVVVPPVVLILGNEAQGVHPALQAGATRVSIPMMGGVESLNVASAGAILMYAMR